MNTIKRVFCSLLVSTLLFSSVAYATTDATPVAPVAMVNIDGATIQNQVGNVFDISFALSNGQGIQNDVHYSVRLMAKTAQGYVPVDEKIYDDTLSLGEKASVQKSIVYTAPEMLSGSYTLIVSSANSKGFPFGTVSLGQVTLTASKKGIELVPGSCSIVSTYTIRFAVSCTAINHIAGNAVATPLISTYTKSLYGEKISSDTIFAPISFKSGEKKIVTIPLSRATTPGMYTVSVALGSTNTQSNTLSSTYVVEGGYGSVTNVSPNADYYKKGDTAELRLIWSGTVEAAVDARITTAFGMVCGTTSVVSIARGIATIMVPISKDCTDPHISLVLKDSTGAQLDEKTIDVQTTSQSQNTHRFSGMQCALLIVLIILVTGGVVYLIRQKKSSTPIVPTILPALLIGLSFALLPLSSAHAMTYPAGPAGDEIWVTVSISGGSSSNPPVYPDTANTSIIISGSLQSSANTTKTVDLSAVTVGNIAVALFDDPVVLAPGATAFATNKILTAPRCDVANPCPRSELVTFSANIIGSGGSSGNIGNVFSIGPYFHGATYDRKVVYVGQQIHPELTVRVKDYGQGLDPYINTGPIPPSNEDQIYIIPASIWSTPMPQIVSCSSNCGNPINGVNYSVVHSVTGANVGLIIPTPYRVCRYLDAPGPAQYFSPAVSSNLSATCQERYPDAEVIR